MDKIFDLVDKADSLINETASLYTKKRKKVSEGKTPNIPTDSEEKVIQALTEEETDEKKTDKVEVKGGDGTSKVTNIKEAEDDEEDVEDEPEDSAPTDDEIGDALEAEEDVEAGKKYLGSKDETFYYLVLNGDDEVTDFQIVDQSGNEAFSSKDTEAGSIIDFLIDALQNLELVDLSYDVFSEYILPEFLEEEETEEEEEESEDEPIIDEPDDAPIEDDAVEEEGI